jgi:hypothetical protein
MRLATLGIAISRRDEHPRPKESYAVGTLALDAALRPRMKGTPGLTGETDRTCPRMIVCESALTQGRCGVTWPRTGPGAGASGARPYGGRPSAARAARQQLAQPPSLVSPPMRAARLHCRTSAVRAGGRVRRRPTCGRRRERCTHSWAKSPKLRSRQPTWERRPLSVRGHPA